MEDFCGLLTISKLYWKPSLVGESLTVFQGPTSNKGQLISKGLFAILNSSKKTNEKLYSSTTMYLRSTCFRSFFWKNLKTTKINLEIKWPLYRTIGLQTYALIIFNVCTYASNFSQHIKTVKHKDENYKYRVFVRNLLVNTLYDSNQKVNTYILNTK